MSKSKSIPRARLRRAGLAVGAAATLFGAGVMAPPAHAATVSVTVNPQAGPEATATPITIDATTSFLNGLTAPVVTFSIPACQSVYNTAASTATSGSNTTTAGNRIVTETRILSTTRLAVTVPVTVTTEQTNNAIQRWNVCVFASATANSELIGRGTYSVGAPPTLISVSPEIGPATGGNTVTIVGTNLPSAITSATVDGIPLTGIKPISSSAFTAVMPAHDSENDLELAVTTATGTVYLQDAYSFQNGISVTPNTASNDQGVVDVAVSGSNFRELTFATGTPNDTNAHVYLVEGDYNEADDSGDKTLPQTAECVDVMVFSDDELICRLLLWQALDPDAAAAVATPTETRNTSADVATTGTNANAIITSASANFTQEDVGKAVVQSGNTNIAAGSYIVSVTDEQTAVLNKNTVIATGGSPATATIGGTRVVASAGVNGQSTMTASVDDAFSQYDVGRGITVTGNSATVPQGTVILSVSDDGRTATLSRPTTGGAATSASVLGETRVPNGAYVFTVVSDGSVDAAATHAADTPPTEYHESIVSSTSTFTVADY